MIKVLVPQDITELGKKILRENGCEVIIGTNCDEETICREIVDCDALIVRTAKYTRRILKSGKKLKIIARYGIGVDNIDVDAANELGIWVTNSPRSSANAVAEHTMLLLLSCARNMGFFYHHYTVGHDYSCRSKVQGMELAGKTLAVLGLGRIGQAVAQKARCGFDMKIIGYDPFLKNATAPEGITLVDDLDDLLPQADFVTLHMPLDPTTRGMVNAEFLSKMKKGAILLNLARGEIVCEQDLIYALRTSTIMGAGLDVVATEPLPTDSPLFTFDNVIITPHSASMTRDAMDIMGADAAQSILEVMSGQVPQWKLNCPVQK